MKKSSFCGPTSACAKVILVGEHSVAYGGEALCLPVSQLRLQLDGSLDSSGIEYENQTLQWASERLCDLSTLRGLLCPKPPWKVSSSIPLGMGMGSSAALSVAWAKWCLESSEKAIKEKDLLDLAVQGESLFHARPSGVDPYTVALEKPILFSGKNKTWQKVSMQKLSHCNLVVSASITPHNTAQVQASIEALRQQNQNDFQNWLQDMGTLVTQAHASITSGSASTLGEAMTLAHKLLAKVGLCTDSAQELADLHLDSGALGAKISGAGCGGIVIALYEKTNSYLPKVANLASTITVLDFSSFE